MTLRSSRIICRWVLMLCVVAAVPSLFAENKEKDKPKDCRKVRVTVLVVLASETKKEVAKQLECLAAKVREHEGMKNLVGFRIDTLSKRSLTMGVAERFELSEGLSTHVVVQSACAKMKRICLKIGPPQMGDITYATPCGKFLPIITPYKTKAGEVVILAVCVQPCPGKQE